MSKQKSECQLQSKYKECCCICKHRLRVIEDMGGEQIGWACIVAFANYDEDIVYVGDYEHGMCSVSSPRPQWRPPSGDEERVTRVNVIAGLRSEIRGLRKAGGAILALYIKDIDVLTKEKLVAIRRMRNILKRYD